MNGRSITACALALAFLAVAGRVALAQDRGQYRGQNTDEWNRQHPTFTDQDRQVTRDWYQQHRNRLGAGWRQQDRLPPYMESRLRRGQRLDPRLRREMHWLPSDLARRYGPAPRGYRYAIIGGNIVLLDDAYQVHDVFRLDFQIR
jgi:Ni/Co efflux regulator RcnB